MLTTVLIAEPDQLVALRERPEYAEALAFTDAQTPAALEAILINRPDIVVVERIFASKSRGAALINRIKADPSLESCEIRIVTHDSGVTRVAPRQTTASSSGGTTTITAVVTTPAVLDQRGTRRAPRHRIIGGIEVLIDGNPALLVDMSVGRRASGLDDAAQAESAGAPLVRGIVESRPLQRRRGLVVVRAAQGRAALPRRHRVLRRGRGRRVPLL